MGTFENRSELQIPITLCVAAGWHPANAGQFKQGKLCNSD